MSSEIPVESGETEEKHRMKPEDTGNIVGAPRNETRYD
jgi:hypothetical protein